MEPFCLRLLLILKVCLMDSVRPFAILEKNLFYDLLIFGHLHTSHVS